MDTLKAVIQVTKWNKLSRDEDLLATIQATMLPTLKATLGVVKMTNYGNSSAFAN